MMQRDHAVVSERECRRFDGDGFALFLVGGGEALIEQLIDARQ